MHLALIADAYPPMKTSCALQMHDLANAFMADGHQITVIIPDSCLQDQVEIKIQDSIRLIKVRALTFKDVSYIRRIFAEFFNPFLIWHQLIHNPDFLLLKFDGVVWYSPTIFWGVLIKKLKARFGVGSYLILRDIFPDWAVDLGLIHKGLIYKLLKFFEQYQYQQADKIGLQSPNSLKYFLSKNSKFSLNSELLLNWIGNQDVTSTKINIQQTKLAGRKIFVYAGNMGRAQGIDRLINLALKFCSDNSVGFIFVGRGEESLKIQELIAVNRLTNTLMFNEIESSEIPMLLKQCDFGLVSLDVRHQTHNIPGKFLTYIYSGLPVLALLNPANDLEGFIEEHNLGMVNTDGDDEGAFCMAKIFIEKFYGHKLEESIRTRIVNIFSPNLAAKQIVTALSRN